MEENEVIETENEVIETDEEFEIVIEGDGDGEFSEVLDSSNSVVSGNDISFLNDSVDNSVFLESIEKYEIYQLYVLVLIFLILLIKGN